MSDEHHGARHGHEGHGHHWHAPSELEARVRALESMLVESGRITSEAVDAVIERYENDVGPMNGARVVAKAWADPEFKGKLLDDTTETLRELELTGFEAEHVVALECTEEDHHVVVCTLCSCYPWALLGLPPSWYKSTAYRARIVSEPRKVLAEFGYELPDRMKVTVWDSSAEVRYLVIPRRPEGTEGWSEEQLAELVTRDSMIGVAPALNPDEVEAAA
jgi:nitrile hydratase subunit alpha